MTDIKVILESGQVDVETLSNEEREVLFDQLSLSTDIPKSTFDSFSEMVSELIKRKLLAEKPELKELLLRRVVGLSAYGNELNTLVVPIIQHIKSGGMDKFGSAMIRKFKPVVHQEPVSSPDAIKVRFDTRVLAVTIDGLEYITPPNEELAVVGIVVNPRCEKLHTYGKNGNLEPIKSTKIVKPTISDKILLGTYNYTDVVNSCDKYFETVKYGDEPSKIYMFKDGTEILDKLFERFSYMRAYSFSQISAQYINTQMMINVSENRKSNKNKLQKVLDFTREPQVQLNTVESEKTPLMKLLESIATISFNTTYSSWLADLYGRGFARVYVRSVLKGLDDPSVTEQIDLYKEKKARVDFAAKLRDKLLDDKNKLGVYKMIIEKKLGVDRSNEIEKKNPQTIKALLALLKPTEVKAVELEYTRREKYLAAWLTNKCAHVRVYRQFRGAYSDSVTKAKFNELSKFFKASRTDSMIQCNVCGFDIICPHIKELTELELSGKNYSEIKAKLTKYIDNAQVRDQYYCKICGELISSLEAFGDVSTQLTTHMDEELKNFIWGEISILTKYLKFTSVVNVPALITTTRDVIYPYIFEIEKHILKSKTNTADEIKAKKRLFITIYAFAYLLRVVTKHKSIEFKNFKASGKNPLVDMIKHVLDIIALSRNIIIREIPGMNIDIIKNKLVEAYKSLGDATTSVITHGQNEDLVNVLMLDPIYRYLYSITVLDEAFRGKPIKHSKMDMVNRIDDIMGESVSKLEKSGDVYGFIKIPKLAWGLKPFENLKPLAGTEPDLLTKYNDARRGYVVRSFELFVSRLYRKLYNESMFIDVSGDKKSATIDVKLREPHQKYAIECAELHTKEVMLFRYRDMYYAKNFTKFGNGSRRWVDPKTKLGRIYDENGMLHSFNIYTYKAGDKIMETRASDIAKATESGTRFTHEIIDKKCSTCGVLWSEVDNIDESVILRALDVKYKLGNFYRFYENRCPVGGLHDYVGTDTTKQVCGKCGYSLQMHTGLNVDFYTKYRTVYEKERSEFAVGGTTTVYKPKPPTDVSKYATEYATWAPNFNIVLELANSIKVNHRLISAMGAVERIEYSEVSSGTYIPPEADNRNDTRIYVLVSHIKNLFTEWNQVRFFHRLVKPPTDLSALIEASGVNRHKLNELGAKLPDIYDDFNARFAYIQRNKKPREITAFCIETFCLLCLKIWNDPVAETEKLRRGFVDYFVKKVLRGEEMMTKPGYFSWSLLYGDKEIKSKESYDSNYSETAEKTVRDVEGEPPADENFGETNEPLTTDALDVETDPDAEPDDDPSNEIRVEGYGLD